MYLETSIAKSVFSHLATGSEAPVEGGYVYWCC